MKILGSAYFLWVWVFYSTACCTKVFYVYICLGNLVVVVVIT